MNDIYHGRFYSVKAIDEAGNKVDEINWRSIDQYSLKEIRKPVSRILAGMLKKNVSGKIQVFDPDDKLSFDFHVNIKETISSLPDFEVERYYV